MGPLVIWGQGSPCYRDQAASLPLRSIGDWLDLVDLDGSLAWEIGLLCWVRFARSPLGWW